MSDTHNRVPIIDLESLCRSNKPVEHLDKTILLPVAKELCDTLHEIGLVYVSNHGIPLSKLNRVNEAAKEFFASPTNLKMQAAKQRFCGMNGFVSIGSATKSKEIFDFMPGHLEKMVLPLNEVFSDFYKILLDIHHYCEQLSHKILFLIGLEINPQDPLIFIQQQNGFIANAVRTYYYPPFDCAEDEGLQLGARDHTDMGTLTLLFQNKTFGLQVKTRKGEYVQVPTVPGTLVLNVGDTLEKWTNGKLVSASHRVIDSRSIGSENQLFAYFVHSSESTAELEDSNETDETRNEKKRRYPHIL